MRFARLLVSVLIVLAITASAARANAPALPGEYPDPTVLEYNGEYIASSTSDRWEPVFPIMTSPDLQHWTQVGAVFDQAPTWAGGERFWAPEFANVDGKLVVFYSGLKKNGQWCIGAASAVQPQGPWTDEGPIVCPPQGAIDPFYFQDDDGSAYLLYKLKGVSQPIVMAPIDKTLLTLTGPPTVLTTPIPIQDGGVNEGPAMVKHSGRYYLFFSTGGCCKPPCTYAEQLARSSSPLGPYERMDHPLLASDANYTCPGHGTPVTGPDGGFYMLHHGYGPDYPDDRRRESLLTRLDWTNDGWLTVDGGIGGAGPPVAETDPDQTATPPTFDDTFAGPGLDRAWQRPITQSPPDTTIAGGALNLACGPGALVARQIAEAPFDVAITVKPPARGTSAVGFRDSGGTLRGLQITPGAVRSVRETPTGRVLAAGPKLGTTRSGVVRVQLSARPGGALFATVSTAGGSAPVEMGPAATGRRPVRLGLGCSGSQVASFRDVRVTGGAWVPANAVALPAFSPEGVGVPISPLRR